MPDCYKGRRCSIGPGQYIERMSPEKRAIISNLKSSDIANLRSDAIWCGEESEPDRQKRRLKEDMLEFDREVLGIHG